MPDAGAQGGRSDQLHLVVRGRVQGVGYRWFTRRAARALRLAGWVANLPDGSVGVAAAGPPDRLEQLVAALRKGPPGATVDGIEVAPGGPAGDLPDPFQIK